MISDQELKLAECVVKLHDGKCYRFLQEMTIPATESDDVRITDDMYLNMCKDIENEKGV